MSDSLQMDDGRKLRLDEHGHLEDAAQWSVLVAEKLAGIDGIELLDVHWKVLKILRAYYDEFEIEVPMRVLVKMLRDQGAAEHASSLALYRLFPEGPVRQGSRYAGLPIPVSCV